MLTEDHEWRPPHAHARAWADAMQRATQTAAGGWDLATPPARRGLRALYNQGLYVCNGCEVAWARRAGRFCWVCGEPGECRNPTPADALTENLKPA